MADCVAPVKSCVVIQGPYSPMMMGLPDEHEKMPYHALK